MNHALSVRLLVTRAASFAFRLTRANIPVAMAVLAGMLMLQQAGCRSVGAKDGFPCSAAGECPSPFQCGADLKCYRHPPADSGQPDSGQPDMANDHSPPGVDGSAADSSPEGGGIVVSPGSATPGEPCSTNADCKSTFCVDGVCCATQCNGTCVACAESYTGSANGTCGSVIGGMDPHESCPATAPETCGNDGLCDGAGACRKHGSNQVCAPAECAGSMFVATRTCDGAGTCPAAVMTDCGTSPCATSGCAKPCSIDANCGGGAFCSAGTCKAKKPNADSCDTAGECVSGFCADGVCCETACTGACLSCSEMSTGQRSGKCQPVQAGKDPDDDCPTDAPSTCGRDGTCDGSGACRKYTAATTCAEASCSGATFTPARKCSAGTCVAATPVNCGQAQCAIEGCRQGCSVDADCGATAYCAAGTCVAKKSNGADCTPGAANQCTSKACVDGKCCETACTGKCYACATVKTGQADGKCAPVSGGTDPEAECADGAQSTCGTDGMCDGSGACRMWSKGTSCATGMCNASGNYLSARTCDGLGTCSPATTDTCAPNVCTATGCSRTCSTNAECLGSTYCAGTTCAAKKAAGATCNVANPTECSSGFCVDGFCCDVRCDGKCAACANTKTGQVNGKCAPVSNGADPDNECASDATKPCGLDGFCNGAGACRMPAAGASCGTAACANPNMFTPAGSCDGAGLCSLGTQRACSGGLTCASTAACRITCAGDGECVSGNFCMGGTCMPKKGAGVACTAAGQCQSNFCSPDGHCCNSACNASGGCQSCTAGTCTTAAASCVSGNVCTNKMTDPANCGTCGKVCGSLTSNNGVAKCVSGQCAAFCAANYRLCSNGAGGYSCAPAVWDMETWSHKPNTCRFGGILSSVSHGGSTSVQLMGSGQPGSPECLQLTNESPACDSLTIDGFAGSNISVWIRSTVADTNCQIYYVGGATSWQPVTRDVWTKLAWAIPAGTPSPSMVSIACDLPGPEGATWYVDDFAVNNQ